VETVAGLYLAFAGIGLASATVPYEPAFATIVRWFSTRRSQAMLALTVVGGFASTIFLPTSNALVDAFGWRDALPVLAGVLAVLTVLPHALVLRRDPADLGLHPDGAVEPPADAAPRGPRSSLRATARWAGPRPHPPAAWSAVCGVNSCGKFRSRPAVTCREGRSRHLRLTRAPPPGYINAC
jgi:MFS family permease